MLDFGLDFDLAKLSLLSIGCYGVLGHWQFFFFYLFFWILYSFLFDFPFCFSFWMKKRYVILQSHDI